MGSAGFIFSGFWRRWQLCPRMVKVVFTRPDFNVGQSPLEGSRMVSMDPRWPKLSGFYVVTTLETILGWFETPSNWPFCQRQPIASLYNFPNIMTGPQKHPKLFSVIFQARTLIIGTQPLHPYVDRRFSFLLDRRNLIIDRFFMDYPLTFSRYNVRVSEAPKAFFVHFWSKDAHIRPKWSLSICWTEVWMPRVLEEVAFWPIFHGPPPYLFSI